ncbi:hypothetical protein M9H77_08537 [Catharanthus roseus]|uniref:Uncharacterized protein n=1 Tax=Catharanthus roseus TaxID=4058 RepID=A0ACC0BY04_CATRO|nr:hypothetical protein M9H77_08537 [Catharanthus roseus]
MVTRFTSAIQLTVIPVRPAGVDRRMMTSMLQEDNDMTSVVIREPPSSPLQIAMPSHRRPWEHVPDRGARGVKSNARRHPGRGEGGGRPPVPPVPERHEHVDPGHAVVERGERSGSGQPIGDPFDSPNLDMPSFSLGLTPASQPLPSGSGTSQMPTAPGLGFASF